MRFFVLGAYQHADEFATLERAQAEKAARAQRQAAQHATGSPHLVPPPGLQDGEACSLLEALTDTFTDPSELVVAKARVKAVFGAKDLFQKMSAREGNKVTLNFFEKAGNIQVVTTAAMEDKVCARVEELEKVYSECKNTDDHGRPLMIEAQCQEFLCWGRGSRSPPRPSTWSRCSPFCLPCSPSCSIVPSCRRVLSP